VRPDPLSRRRFIAAGVAGADETSSGLALA